MRNRFLVILSIAVVVLGLIISLLFIKKIISTRSSQSQTQEQAVELKDVESRLSEAEDLIEKGGLLEAKGLYQELLEASLPSEQMSAVQSKLENLNVRILLSGINIEQSQVYEVKPGDVLINIAKNFNTTVESIAKANNIKENIIRPGMKLRILKGQFSILVDKSQNVLVLKFNDEVIKTYMVATGKNNSTPIGTYKIINKLIDPIWYKEGKAIPASSPDNILGSRWLGFNIPEYGIHGTTKPEEIGKQITEGCVRMRNEDVAVRQVMNVSRKAELNP
jgi:lipoprotein-anchoring transpeptidase ErfK/SrfK